MNCEKKEHQGGWGSRCRGWRRGGGQRKYIFSFLSLSALLIKEQSHDPYWYKLVGTVRASDPHIDKGRAWKLRRVRVIYADDALSLFPISLHGREQIVSLRLDPKSKKPLSTNTRVPAFIRSAPQTDAMTPHLAGHRLRVDLAHVDP